MGISLTPQLKPYVTTTIAATKSASLPSFSPMPPKTEGSIAQRGRDAAKWTKLYRALPLSDKNALIMDARRKWYDALAERFPAGRDEEGLARALEARADGAPARS
jgi:hypothetical protein